MIKKLRRKFVLINMILVTIVMCIVMGMLITTRVHAFHQESDRAMRRIIQMRQFDMHRLDLDPEKRRQPVNSTPVFLVILNEDGTIETIVSPESSEVTEALAQEAVKGAMLSDNEEGFLSDLRLRFLKQQTPDGQKIAFADTVQETRTLRELILTCVLGFMLALLCFLIISIFLARFALRPVEATWEQQNQFIADASHELKTPLTVILANLRILLSHTDSTIAAEKKWLENTQAEASRMKELVENLMFLARSDANSPPFKKTTFSLSDLAWSCLLPFEPVAFEQGVSITEEITDGLYLTGDCSQIKQLFIILLDNACKYAGNEKSVSVSLKKESDRILLKVRNSGTPIAQKDLPHLFERFYRTDKSRARTAGGYGLGLAIAQTIVKNHRGKIIVTSEEYTGTTFTVTLPAGKGTAE